MELWPESDRLSSSWLIPRTEERAYTVIFTQLFITLTLIGREKINFSDENWLNEMRN